MEEIIGKWVLEVIQNHLEEIEEEVLNNNIDSFCKEPLPAVKVVQKGARQNARKNEKEIAYCKK